MPSRVTVVNEYDIENENDFIFVNFREFHFSHHNDVHESWIYIYNAPSVLYTRYNINNGCYSTRGVTLYLKGGVRRGDLGVETPERSRGGALVGGLGTKSSRSWKIVSEHWHKLYLRFNAFFCNSIILYYKHSYSSCGVQLQTPAISYYFDKERNNMRWRPSMLQISYISSNSGRWKLEYISNPTS